MANIERWWLYHVSDQARDHAIVTGPAIWRGAGDEPVEVVRASTYQGAVEALQLLRDACGHCIAAGNPPTTTMMNLADRALRDLGGQS
jgi:hypothetical protein